MAREGMRLTQFYVNASTCSPSRAGLLSGRQYLRTGVNRVLWPMARIGLPKEEVTLPELLRDRGYATACIGKWHLGDKPEFLPTSQGFDRYFGIPYSNDMDTSGLPPTPLMRDQKIIEQPAKQDTLTRSYTEEAIRFIGEMKERPFFLYLPHTFPHVPLHASEQFRGKSARGLYGDVVEELDWSTGEILKTLRELKLDANTLVMFTSDNGPWLTKGRDGGSAGPLRNGKTTVYEGGVREPCVAWWPGHIAPGTTCDEPAITLDLLPTFALLAGAQLPQHRKLDGKDIRGLLFGTGHREDHEFFFTQIPGVWAIRSENWKMHYRAQQGDKPPHVELYNLAEDVGEKNNLAAQNPTIVSNLTQRGIAMDKDIRADYQKVVESRPASVTDKVGSATVIGVIPPAF